MSNDHHKSDARRRLEADLSDQAEWPDDPHEAASRIPDRSRGFAFFGGKGDDEDPMRLARQVADRDRIGFGDVPADDQGDVR